MRMRMGKVWDEWDIEIGTLVGVSENVRMILSLNGMRMRKVWDEIKIGGSWNIYIKFRFNIMRMRIVWELWECEKYEMSEILRLEPWWESPTTTHPSPLPPVEWADSPDPGWKKLSSCLSWSWSSFSSWSWSASFSSSSSFSSPSSWGTCLCLGCLNHCQLLRQLLFESHQRLLTKNHFNFDCNSTI